MSAHLPSSSSTSVPQDEAEGSVFRNVRQCGVTLSFNEAGPGNFLWLIFPQVVELNSPEGRKEYKQRTDSKAKLKAEFKKAGKLTQSHSYMVRSQDDLKGALEDSFNDAEDATRWYIVILSHGDERGRISTSEDGLEFYTLLRQFTRDTLVDKIHIYAGQCGGCEWVTDFNYAASKDRTSPKLKFTASSYVDGATGFGYSVLENAEWIACTSPVASNGCRRRSWRAHHGPA
jgi:hypothetical protein